MTPLAVERLSPDLCVSPQLGPESMALAAKQGFRSIVNNRPDFEAGPEQPTSAVIEDAAIAAGLAYAHLPVAPAFQSAEEIAQFAALLATMPKPVLAFCRSGARSGKLFLAATRG